MDGLERVLNEDPLLRSGASPSLKSWTAARWWGFPNELCILNDDSGIHC